MKSPVNKSLESFIKKKVKQYKNIINDKVSIITCTNKQNTLSNIISNYDRQDLKNKELIIIINKDSIDFDSWKNKIKDLENIRLFKLSEKASLGNCLNYAVSKSQYDIIAKFDDDDYYGPKYLSDTIKSFRNTSAKVIVKAANFVYFVEKKVLAIRTPSEENKFVYFGNGSTLVFKKEIFNRVSFRNISIAEDVHFCQDCIKNSIKIYSTNKYHHIYFRHPVKDNHTWKINDDEFIKKYCKVIGQVEDYISYANYVSSKR